MIPASIKGKIFVILTLVNLGLASYFAAITLYDQSAVSGVTTLLCLAVWITETLSDQKGE
jgi:hypothetical protein